MQHFLKSSQRRCNYAFITAIKGVTQQAPPLVACIRGTHGVRGGVSKHMMSDTGEESEGHTVCYYNLLVLIKG